MIYIAGKNEVMERQELIEFLEWYEKEVGKSSSSAEYIADVYLQTLPDEQEGKEVCACEYPVPQATMSHICQNCYKTLRNYA